ncbi:MAG: hypothetical protein CMG75_09795 [Candidatus Marinimicrobia bacterium]|nr:hypothetical protein [Candidatus Neomarinimicrobiota bacterium]|tara:strand:- start:8805 stop:10100 length:1296 start_codon:yes stop_codon:yes gene_type:complete
MKNIFKPSLFIIFLSLPIWSQELYDHSKVVDIPDMSFLPGVFTGLDILEERMFDLIKGKRLAILTNQTSLNREGKHLLDLLYEQKDLINVEIIFTPQFGILNNQIQSLESSPDKKDKRFNAIIKNLWGHHFKPNSRDFRNVDLVIIDVQDTGVRYQTIMTTVTKMMEAAADYGKPVIVLDRPNPINGNTLEGPVIRPQFQSLKGYHLVPIRHGMTVGELSIMINETGWIRGSERCELTVIPMANWNRKMWFDETGLVETPLWKDIENTDRLLSSVGLELLTGTNLSFGEGTNLPYKVIGAPWLVSKQLIAGLIKANLPGVIFKTIQFMPDSLSLLVSRPIYRNETCYGIELLIQDRDRFKPVKTAVNILSLISVMEPRRFKWIGNNYIDLLYGHNYLRIFLAQERNVAKLPATWSQDLIRFNNFRQKFLLY